MLIFLADLGHNQLTISSDVYPLGIANLAAYLKAYGDIQEPLQIRIFREPADLRSALDSSSPDVLGVSNYSWNHELSLHFARYAKSRNPAILTLLGGPNFPLNVGEQELFLRGIPEIDVAACGPTYEGEKAFSNILRRYTEAGYRVDGLQEEPVAGGAWISRRTGVFVKGTVPDRMRDLDEIPSPYLGGWMDPFFATGYFPMMQIARGCPFTCAYCCSSSDINSKITRHSVENVKTDLLYIAQRVRPEITLSFADDNFGMYGPDEEIAEFLGWLQDRFDWPHYVRTTTGKNNHRRILRVMRKARGMLPFTAAVQSLNPVVLENVKRSNIKLESYAAIQKELQSEGMQGYGELIISMPGETKASFMQAVHDLIETGVKRISAHQLMLLHGAPLSNPESRELHRFGTRFRVVARNIGNYTGEPVVETEEIVVETPTFSFQDYLEARVFHLLLTIFYYEGNLEEAFEFARQEGIGPYELICRIQRSLDTAPPAFRQVIDDFLRESQEELFVTKEACIEWSRANFDRLVDGTLGGNLLSKYSLLARLCTTQASLDFLEATIADAIGSTRDARIAPLRAVISYLRAVQLHVPFAKTLDDMPSWTSGYDVDAWRRDGYSRKLAEYGYAEPRSFVAKVDPERRRLIGCRVATFGEHPSQLGKFTRTMFARDLRRSLFEADTQVESVTA